MMNGILLNFFIYYGQMNDELTNQAGDITVTGKITLTLIENYLHEGRHLFIDNFYTAPTLAKYLLDNDTYVTGTIHSNRRNFGRHLVTDAIEKGQTIFYKCEQHKVLSMKYWAVKDKSQNKPKVICLLSTANNTDIANTNKNDREGNPIKKPQAILDYNTPMGGGVDQVPHQSLAIRKMYKWYKKVAIHLVSHCILNSHSLC